MSFVFQEIEPRCGEALAKLFPPDDNVDLSSIVRKARKTHHTARSSERRPEPFRGPPRGDFSRLETFLFGLVGA